MEDEVAAVVCRGSRLELMVEMIVRPARITRPAAPVSSLEAEGAATSREVLKLEEGML